MVRYLDLERSNRSQPNENFARELMELFTTGPGPYGEKDVKEAARAFTGHHLRNGRFVFSEPAHDPRQQDRPRRRPDRSRGDDVVDILAAPSAPPRASSPRSSRGSSSRDEPREDGRRRDRGGVARDRRRRPRGPRRALPLGARSSRRPRAIAVTRSPAALIAAAARLLGAALAARQGRPACASRWARRCSTRRP